MSFTSLPRIWLKEKGNASCCLFLVVNLVKQVISRKLLFPRLVGPTYLVLPVGGIGS